MAHHGRRRLLAAALAVALPAWARETPGPGLLRALPGAQLQGRGRLRFLGFAVYDARLWAPQTVTADNWAETPLALELTYARRLEGRAIAEASIDQMQRQATLPPERAQRWLADLTRLFPDVDDGDRLAGLHRPGEGVQFFLNGTSRGELRDAEFARLFFGIWLSPQTSEPGLRQQLLAANR